MQDFRKMLDIVDENFNRELYSAINFAKSKTQMKNESLWTGVVQQLMQGKADRADVQLLKD